jgi:hypothetical protein
MERKKTIQELISALETLRLQEADLTAQLEQALVGQQDTTQEAVKTTKKEEKRSNTQSFFNRGDRIWIKNKLHKPANWSNHREWVEREGRTATVTEVVTRGPSEQVHFITDNGVHTWRAPNNVQLLTSPNSTSS